MRHVLTTIRAGLLMLAVATGALAPAQAPAQAQPAEQAQTWPLTVFDRPFDDAGPSHPADYQPLQQAARPWQLCVLYPHLKDAYWLSVNFGMVEEARRLGVGFNLYEAGGYPNLSRQIAQLRECSDPKYDAVVIGTVSYAGLTPVIQVIARSKPVIAVVNDIDPTAITAKASVPWADMGRAAGAELARLHPKGSAPVNVLWFPGPEAGGWVAFIDRGFREALSESSARIVEVLYGDTGREAQAQLVEQAVAEDRDIDYFVGSGPMAEVAVSILRARGETGRIGLISTYMSHGVFRGIRRGRILAAPADSPVVQGRLGIEMAVRALEGKLTIRHAGPAIKVITPGNAQGFDRAANLAPASFLATFFVQGKAR